MSKRITRGLTLAVGGTTLALIASAVVLATLNSYDLWMLDFLIGAALAALVACMITLYRPSNPISWLIAAFALCWAGGEFARQYALYGVLTAPGALPAAHAMASPAYWAWYPGIFLAFVFVPLYFPNGRLVSPRWRLVVWFALVVALLMTGLGAVQPGDDETPGISNPLAVDSLPSPEALFPPLFVSFLGLFVAAGVSQVVRFRRAVGEERQQIKWFTYAVVLNVCYILMHRIFLIDRIPLVVTALLNIVFLANLWIAIAIAVLRYRLYDIDVIIRRTLIYATLTAALGLVYVGCIVLLQTLTAPLVGGSELAIVASTLAIAALFTPLRRRIQTFIDKRFYRRKYDVAKTLAAFSTRLRDETDLDALTAELLHVVDETMQPVHVSLWLKPTTDGRSSAVEGKHV